MREVLIISTCKETIGLLKPKLHEKGFKTNIVNGRYEILEFIKKRCPEIVITELVMPDIDGFEILREARLLCKNVKIVVIHCVTSKISVNYEVMAKRLGVNKFITSSNNYHEIVTYLENI